jgi:L-ascorbate metabolism protein UlaG (beta-lactamase superfamily)
VNGYQALNVHWSVDANANTGGVVTEFQCTYDMFTNPGALWTELDTTTVASAATQASTTESVNLVLLPYNRCRFGWRFGTGDDADAAAEDLNAAIVLVK